MTEGSDNPSSKRFIPTTVRLRRELRNRVKAITLRLFNPTASVFVFSINNYSSHKNPQITTSTWTSCCLLSTFRRNWDLPGPNLFVHYLEYRIPPGYRTNEHPFSWSQRLPTKLRLSKLFYPHCHPWLYKSWNPRSYISTLRSLPGPTSLAKFARASPTGLTQTILLSGLAPRSHLSRAMQVQLPRVLSTCPFLILITLTRRYGPPLHFDD